MARIAVASRHNTHVDEHFGRAAFFYIYEAGPEGHRFLESRDAVSAGQQPFGHDVSRFDRIIDLLADCDVLLVGQIGEGAASYLIRRGVRVMEAAGPIDKVLEVLSRELFPETDTAE